MTIVFKSRHGVLCTCQVSSNLENGNCTFFRTEICWNYAYPKRFVFAEKQQEVVVVDDSEVGNNEITDPVDTVEDQDVQILSCSDDETLPDLE